MKRALVFGATKRESLGRKLALLMLADGITPILVGRSAKEASLDSEVAGAEFITADLMDPNVSEQVMAGLGDLSDIEYVVIAGGGPHLKGKLGDYDLAERRAVRRTIDEAPTEIVAAFHASTQQPYRLITVASRSATLIRKDETIYATAQAARRAFALNFHHELAQRFGSKNLLVCPGGMKTSLWAGKAVNTSNYMDPAAVAQIIWRTTKEQVARLIELTVHRGHDGTPWPSERIYIDSDWD